MTTEKISEREHGKGHVTSWPWQH